MTLPGLALFYAGLVQAKNVVSVLMQHFALACLMSLLWAITGYSLAFSGSGAWFGSFDSMFMIGLGFDALSGTIPESVFAAFQMTFAIITPALVIGASMLWVGWFDFNCGSALGAGNNAGIALIVTHIAAATVSLTWMFIEWKRFGRPSLVGIVTGMVAGLATVTPASGFIGVRGGLILSLVGGVGCYLAVGLIRVKLQIDDSLDVFAVHGVGDILGSLGAAFLALPTFGGLGLGLGLGEGVSAGA